MESTGTEVARAAEVVAPSPPLRVARPRIAVVLLLLGLAVAFVPGLAAGNSFLPRSTWIPIAFDRPIPTTFRIRTVTMSNGLSVFVAPATPTACSKLTDLVSHDPGWAAAVAALLTGAPLFLWWRRGGLPSARLVGFAACAASATAVCVFVLVPRSAHEQTVGGIWWTMPLGALLMAAAFLVAPAPVRSRDY